MMIIVYNAVQWHYVTALNGIVIGVCAVCGLTCLLNLLAPVHVRAACASNSWHGLAVVCKAAGSARNAGGAVPALGVLKFYSTNSINSTPAQCSGCIL